MKYLFAAVFLGLLATTVPARSQTPPPRAQPDTLARPNAYRFRVLGVFDDQTGDPVLPGLQSVPGPGGSKYVASSRRPCQGPALRGCTTVNCYVSVYIDGVRTFDASTMTDRNQVPDFGRMNPRDYAAAEFYAGGASVPAQYNATNSGCGVLLLWTRER